MLKLFAWGHSDVCSLFDQAIALIGLERLGGQHGMWGPSYCIDVADESTAEPAFEYLAERGCGVSLYEPSDGPDLPQVLRIVYPANPTHRAVCRLCGREDDHSLRYVSMSNPTVPICRECDRRVMEEGPIASQDKLYWAARLLDVSCEDCGKPISPVYDRTPSGWYINGPRGLPMPRCSSGGSSGEGLFSLEDGEKLLCHQCHAKAQGDFLKSPTFYDDVGEKPTKRWVWCNDCQAFTAIVVLDPTVAGDWDNARCKECGQKARVIWYGHAGCYGNVFALISGTLTDVYCPICRTRVYGGRHSEIKRCKAEGCNLLGNSIYGYCEEHWQEEALSRIREYNRTTSCRWHIKVRYGYHDGVGEQIEEKIRGLTLEQAVRQHLIAICDTSNDRGVIFDNRSRWTADDAPYIQFYLWKGSRLITAEPEPPAIPREEILKTMHLLREQDERGGTLFCEVCHQEKPAAGAVVYGVTTYCNDCAIVRELEQAGYQVKPAFG